jgi:hypothetical protein
MSDVMNPAISGIYAGDIADNAAERLGVQFELRSVHNLRSPDFHASIGTLLARSRNEPDPLFTIPEISIDRYCDFHIRELDIVNRLVAKWLAWTDGTIIPGPVIDSSYPYPQTTYNHAKDERNRSLINGLAAIKGLIRFPGEITPVEFESKSVTFLQRALGRRATRSLLDA